MPVIPISPLPWAIDGKTPDVEIVSRETGAHVVCMGHGDIDAHLSEADARAIVTAVNCHDDLVAALRAFVSKNPLSAAGLRLADEVLARVDGSH